MKTHRLMQSALFLPALLLLFVNQPARAGSATWDLKPTSGDWNTAANWAPNTVPNGRTDVATFAASNITDVSLSAIVLVDGLTFNPGASAFIISPAPPFALSILNGGITNNSGLVQNFMSTGDGTGTSSFITFGGTATAGDAINITNSGGGNTTFASTSNAGTATITNEGAAGVGAFMNGATSFNDSTSAGNAIVTNDSATGGGGLGGYTAFADNATAANVTFTNLDGGVTDFVGSATSASSILIADNGAIRFFNKATGGTARVELLENGSLSLLSHNPPGITIGSVEGEGVIYLGSNTLTIGSSSLSTTFSGSIFDGLANAHGSLAKVGAGTLILSGSNSYTGMTTVSAGSLVISNLTGSGTGTGAVQVNAGTLGGGGIISGAVTVGKGSGTGAFLAPAHGTKTQSTLTIQSGLTFNADATYTYTFKAKGNKAKTDKVVANGVTINGATFAFQGSAQGALRQGLVLTAISNTAATPITGTFANLADGAILTVNGNNFQASYEGGDGNDLTLTVTP